MKVRIGKLMWFLECIALLPCFSLVGCGESSMTLRVVTRVALEDEPTTEDIGWRFVGVGSCTAAGCHGNARPHEIAGSEYNIWISADPHSRAHSVLYDERSLDMVRRLDGKETNVGVRPYEDPRCVSCHSTTFFAASVDAAGEVVTDGVGCEACHGPAEGWLAEHYRPDFDAKRERLGMWNTKDLYSRAQICASCHVGSPGREVNHDLIAAGHPRLQFEMGAYLQALPKHWDERADRERFDGNFEFLTWVLGQAATSRAAVKQLEHRAKNGMVWPELSEWSCGACHHDLLDDTQRQSQLANAGGLSGETIRWDDWNHHVVRESAALIAAALGQTRSADALQAKLAKLSQLAGGVRSDRQAVAAAARSIEGDIDTWAAEVGSSRLDRAGLTSLMRSLVSHYQQGVVDSAEAMLLYDALASLQQSQLDTLAADKKEPSDVDRAITAKLTEMFTALTAEGARPTPEPVRVESTSRLLDDMAKLLEAQEGQP